MVPGYWESIVSLLPVRFHSQHTLFNIHNYDMLLIVPSRSVPPQP